MTKPNQLTPAAIAALASEDYDNFITAATPGGIEAQEAQGQRTFVASQTLPRDHQYNTQEDFESLGFVFGEPVDDLFVSCQFPAGWTKQPTGHSLWSDIVDDKGRKRASVFYKAAFYDRSSFVTLNSRYHISKAPVEGYDKADNMGRRSMWTGKVIDSADGTAIYETELLDASLIKDDRDYYRATDSLSDEAAIWAKENIPMYRDPLAYWNE